MPLLQRTHPGSDTRPAVHQALGREDADRFAIGGARHLALFAGLDLAVEYVSGPIPARHDRDADVAGDGSMQPQCLAGRTGAIDSHLAFAGSCLSFACDRIVRAPPRLHKIVCHDRDSTNAVEATGIHEKNFINQAAPYEVRVMAVTDEVQCQRYPSDHGDDDTVSIASAIALPLAFVRVINTDGQSRRPRSSVTGGYQRGGQ